MSEHFPELTPELVVRTVQGYETTVVRTGGHVVLVLQPGKTFVGGVVFDREQTVKLGYLLAAAGSDDPQEVDDDG